MVRGASTRNGILESPMRFYPGTPMPGVLRALTHLDISDEDVAVAAEAIPRALGVLARA